MTAEDCCENAGRLLLEAEMVIPDVVRAQQLEHLADSWTALGHLIDKVAV